MRGNTGKTSVVAGFWEIGHGRKGMQVMSPPLHCGSLAGQNSTIAALNAGGKLTLKPEFSL